jgi:hypothetical protein
MSLLVTPGRLTAARLRMSTAMRHVSALQSAPFGSDWCDVLVQAEGHTLVIGDVAGHDATAARAMVRLRTPPRGASAGPMPVIHRRCRSTAMASSAR